VLAVGSPAVAQELTCSPETRAVYFNASRPPDWQRASQPIPGPEAIHDTAAKPVLPSEARMDAPSAEESGGEAVAGAR
jgi:hypothetical protein